MLGRNARYSILMYIREVSITGYNSSVGFVCFFLPDLDLFLFFFGFDGSAAASCCRLFASSSSYTSETHALNTAILHYSKPNDYRAERLCVQHSCYCMNVITQKAA